MAVVEKNSFSLAANELVLAQSTVSAHIKGLEDALGVVLFTRDAKKHIMLTDKGKEIYGYAKSIVEQCIIMSDEASEKSSKQQISIAASTDSFEYLLPGLMAEYMHQYNTSRFELINGDSAFVHEQILSGNARLGFSGTALNRNELKYRAVCRDRLVMITPNNERYRKMKRIGRYGCDLFDEPMIVRSQSSGTQKEFDKYLEKNGFADKHLHIVAKMNSADAVKSSVASGLGVAVISEMAAKKYALSGDLLVFDLDKEGAYRDIYLLHKKGHVFSKAERNFVAFAVQHIKNGQEQRF
ncbi:MAG: LysR family transcriptional regulator [Christensenellaceae bacterium]|nr:LysR family transcriptional regulator [Christensenellaceae bacterium]